jgi:hypothetical protein
MTLHGVLGSNEHEREYYIDDEFAMDDCLNDNGEAAMIECDFD